MAKEGTVWLSRGAVWLSRVLLSKGAVPLSGFRVRCG